VKTGAGHFVEIQGTAEDGCFSEEELHGLMAMADKGTRQLIALQREIVGDIPLLKAKKAEA
jgi:ribonuclease PH